MTIYDTRRTEALAYLSRRTATDEQRSQRYEHVLDYLLMLGLHDGELMFDVGAGMCDFGAFLYESGWRGRYVPFDASIDGINLEIGLPSGADADWIVAIELLEHLSKPMSLVTVMQQRATRGLVITTPNTDRLGADAVRAMDSTHVRPIFTYDLIDWGFEVIEASCFGEPGDTLIGIWRAI